MAEAGRVVYIECPGGLFVKIVIVGAGLVGSSLAQQLLLEGHDIAVVEKDALLCSQLEEKQDMLVIRGSGSDPSRMMAAGINSADALLAVTPSDEVNIIACSIAMFHGVSERVARIRNPEYFRNKAVYDIDRMGVTRLIDPEVTVVDAVCQFISTPGAMEAVAFESGRILLREYKVTADMPVVGKSLREIREMSVADDILVMTVVRDDKAIIPDGELRVEVDDEILIIFAAKSRDAFMDMMALPRRQTQKVVISGSSLTCLKLADRLQDRVEKVIWVSPDYKFGDWGASQLDRVEVLHGDCTDEDLLREIHIENAGFFIAASKNTEHNVMSSLLAKAHHVRETITISDQPVNTNRLLKSLGIDHIINPRLTTAASIMDLIHQGRILSEIKLKDMDLEAVRVIASPNCRAGQGPLSRSWRPLARKAIVGAVIRNQELIIPTGDTVIQPGDQALVITRARSMPAIKKMFRER